jgi:hypothetical protein
MSLLELRRRLRDQTVHRRWSNREIRLKNFTNARGAINTLARRMKNM